MTPDVQREALTVIGELLTFSPEVRLGQLLAHLGFLGECHLGHGLGDIEDDEFIAVLYRHRAELLARQQGTPDQVPPTNSTTSVSGSPTSVATTPAIATA